MSKRHKIKHTPKNIPKVVKDNFINEKGYLEVNINSKVPAIQDFLIKLHYYPYLEYIYKYGKGRVFSFQLVDYITKIYKVSERMALDNIDEMYYYRLIEKKVYFNSRIIYLTAPASNFFGPPLKLNIDIGALMRTAFLCEHVNLFQPERRDFYNGYIEQQGFLLPDKLEHLRERLFIIPEKIVKNTNGDILITFGFLDINQTKRPCDIREKIEVVNSFFLPSIENVYFKINFCVYDQERFEYIKGKWDKQSRYLINASKYKGIEFTNLNVKRYFDYHSKKRGMLKNDK